MSNPILALIPSGYNTGTVYSILPNDGSGDFTYDRDTPTDGTRVRKDGLIEQMGNDIPRLDWLNSNCPSLLLEPQSTNLITYSEDFSQSAWNKSNTSIQINTTTSPSGNLDGSTLTDNATNSIHRLRDAVSLSASTNYSLSVFAKKNTLSNIQLALINTANSNTISKVFDLENGVIGEELSQGGTTVSDAKIENYGNGWFRCIIVGQLSSSPNQYQITLATQSTGNSQSVKQVTYSGDGTGSVFLYGAQVEELSCATSYIPTNGSTATRNADDCKLDNFGSMPSNYPITVYGEVLPNELSADSHAFSLLQNVDTSGSYYLSLELTSTTDLKIKRRDADTNDADTISHTLAIGTPFKFAVCFQNETDYKYSFDGLSAVSVTTSDTVTWDYNDVLLGTLRLVSDTGSRNPIKDFRLYDTELTDAELTKLTT